MKKIFYAITAVALLLIYGCGKEQNVIEPEKELDLVTYTFTASYAEDEEVRSTLSNEGAFEWVADDAIAIYNRVTSKYVDFNVVSVDEDGDATIEALASPGAVWTNAIYPAARAKGAGNEVDYTVNSVAGPILVCQVTGQTLSFKYLGSVANIQVTDVPDTPESLTFTANANVFGCRSFTWGEGADPKPILGGSGTVASITVPFNASGITSVPLPNTSYAGFTITVDNASGRHLYKKSTSNTFDLSSKILLPMPALTYVAPVYSISTTTTSSPSVTVTNAPMVRTADNVYELGINSAPVSSYSVYDSYNDNALATGSFNSESNAGIYIYGSIWDNWNWNKGEELKTQNGVLSFKNKTFSEDTYYRFHSTGGGNDKIGPANGDELIVAGNSYTEYWRSNEPGAFKTVAGTYDFYIVQGNGNEVTLYAYNHNSSSLRPDYRTTLFVFNSSTNSVSTPSDKGIHKSAFGSYDSMDDLHLCGDFSGSWVDDAYTFTYNGNHSWTLTLDLSSKTATAEYTFKFRKGNNWTAGWGNPNNNTYPKSGSKTYGTCEGGGAYNLHVDLEPAVYTVHVNDMTWESNKLRFDFVKR